MAAIAPSRDLVQRIVRETVFREMAKRPDLPPVPQLVVNSSARHMHVSQENLEILFGPGAKLEVRGLDRAQKNELAVGALDSHDNLIDITTGMVKLRAVFDNKDETLFPNQFVNVRMLVDTVKDAVVVPVAAIQRGPAGIFVYRAKADDTVEIRVVELGASDGEKVQITAGLQLGDQVVIDGTDRLRDGAKIRRPGAGPRPPAGPPVAAAPPDGQAAPAGQAPPSQQPGGERPRRRPANAEVGGEGGARAQQPARTSQ